MRKLVIFLAAIAFVFGTLVATPSAYAQGKKGGAKAPKAEKTKAAKPGKVSGTVSSVSDTSLLFPMAAGPTKRTRRS